MTLVIIVLFITISSISLFTSQVINQIKFTKKTENSIAEKYELNAGYEIAVSELLKGIKINVEESKVEKTKVITISYLPSLEIKNPIYFQTKEYDIEIKSELDASSIDIKDSKLLNIMTNGNKKIITLQKDDNSLDNFYISYDVSVKSKSSNVKEDKKRIEIQIDNIYEINSYGVSYKITTV